MCLSKILQVTTKNLIARLLNSTVRCTWFACQDMSPPLMSRCVSCLLLLLPLLHSLLLLFPWYYHLGHPGHDALSSLSSSSVITVLAAHMGFSMSINYATHTIFLVGVVCVTVPLSCIMIFEHIQLWAYWVLNITWLYLMILLIIRNTIKGIVMKQKKHNQGNSLTSKQNIYILMKWPSEDRNP